jgi:hypothetical protein
MRAGIPPAGIGELSEPAAVTVVAACPGGHERGAREQVTLVVAACPVGQDEGLHGIDAAAHSLSGMSGYLLRQRSCIDIQT